MTENEQKQQLSVAYVHAVAARTGYTCQVQTVDADSVDLIISASGKVHERSVTRSPRLAVQLKASSSLKLQSEHLVFPLPIKNYDDLRREMLVPSILVVLVLPKDPTHWLETTEICSGGGIPRPTAGDRVRSKALQSRAGRQDRHRCRSCRPTRQDQGRSGGSGLQASLRCPP